jgi:hypothetical protein
VEGVLEGGGERVGGGYVVGDARDGGELGRDVLEGLRGSVGLNTEGFCDRRLTSQTPRRRTRKLSGKRDESIWLMRNTFEVRADSSMMGMLEV